MSGNSSGKFPDARETRERTALLVEIELEVADGGGIDPEQLPDDVIESIEALGDVTVQFACTSVTPMSD